MSGLKRLWRSEAGAALVEYAFVLPVLLLLVFGLMQLGGMAWTQAALDYAVQQAARCATVRPDLCGTPAQVQAYAATQALGLSVPASAFQVNTGAACGAEIAANLRYGFILSPFNAASVPLTAQVCHR